MELKKFKPITSSQRGLIMLNRSSLSKSPLLKKDIYKIKKVSGRDKNGKLVFYHRGGGHKRQYRKVDFLSHREFSGIVCSLEYDPYRNSNIMSIYDFIKKNYFYRIQPKYIQVGDIIESGENAKPMNGHSLPISKIPVGSFIHNISLKKMELHKYQDLQVFILC